LVCPVWEDQVMEDLSNDDGPAGSPEAVQPRIIDVDGRASAPTGPPEPTPSPPAVPAVTETVEQPAKVMRMGSMIKQLLEEVRLAPLDEAGRSRLKEIYETSVQELSEGLSPDLAAELARVATPFTLDPPSQAELRIAQAQLVGWLEGLFHGIQATMFAQQMAARAQAEEAQRRGLPGSPMRGEDAKGEDLPGTYL
jgi:hypothetical protein